jgi:hypothetical protein
VENLRISPEIPIATITDKFYPVASEEILVYSAELLQPNTTYNVSAIVAGTPSWWVFTTSSEPSQFTSATSLHTNNTWVAVASVVAVTSAAILIILLKKKARFPFNRQN